MCGLFRFIPTKSYKRFHGNFSTPEIRIFFVCRWDMEKSFIVGKIEFLHSIQDPTLISMWLIEEISMELIEVYFLNDCFKIKCFVNFERLTHAIYQKIIQLIIRNNYFDLQSYHHSPMTFANTYQIKDLKLWNNVTTKYIRGVENNNKNWKHYH